ncbi:Hypothetical protein, putative, partial [Bodo saltans]
IAVDRDNNLLFVSNYYYCVYRLASNGASAQVIAGSSTTSGTADGVGGAARFSILYGITCDTINNIAYISDKGNNRIRTLTVSNNDVTTLAGSSYGSQDGIGVAAQFSNPFGIVHYTSRIDGMVLFVADNGSNRIRRVVVASATVTTVAQTTYICYYLCISRDGSSLFVGTSYTVVRINTSTNAVVTLAGGTSSGSTDGIGTSARFNAALGIALNGDETALIVADFYNELVRRIELSTNNVATIAGATATTGLVDGPGLAARFYYPQGGKWYCNTTSLLCGLLMADRGSGAIRFVAVELLPTETAELSGEATASVSRSSTMPLSGSLTASQSVIATCTTSITQSLSPTKSKSDSIVTSASTTADAITNTSSKATRTASITTRTPSPSVTMYCALVPADGTSSVGSLQQFNSTALSL